MATAKATEPKIAMKAEASYATTLIGEKIKIGNVQKIGALKTLKDGITYSALDIDYEKMTDGKRKAETVDIELLYTQEEHKALVALGEAGTMIYLFIKYPESTASATGKPLVQTVKCTVDIAGQEISDGELFKDTLRIFKQSDTVETDGYPTATDESKF